MTRLTEVNGQNQALKSYCVEVKFLILALRFLLFYACFLCALLAIICLFSLGLVCVCVLSILSC